MSESEIQVKVGQLWRRKRDGKTIRIVRINAEWDDTYWVGEDFKGRGAIYFYNLRVKYELVQDVD